MDPISGAHDGPLAKSTFVTGMAALGTMAVVALFVALTALFTSWAAKVGLIDWLARCCMGQFEPMPDLAGRQRRPPRLPPRRELAISALAGDGTFTMRPPRGATAAPPAPPGVEVALEAPRPQEAPPPPPPEDADLEA